MAKFDPGRRKFMEALVSGTVTLAFGTGLANSPRALAQDDKDNKEQLINRVFDDSPLTTEEIAPFLLPRNPDGNISVQMSWEELSSILSDPFGAAMVTPNGHAFLTIGLGQRGAINIGLVHLTETGAGIDFVISPTELANMYNFLLMHSGRHSTVGDLVEVPRELIAKLFILPYSEDLCLVTRQDTLFMVDKSSGKVVFIFLNSIYHDGERTGIISKFDLHMAIAMATRYHLVTETDHTQSEA